ncbi:DUF421 domain-containing protein [Phycicoccus sp. BSK3Z-2]|uniref:DUF421 domain-containing protein n=1 Tax=Phycicoccus avicenniae TaxID=2828860 RepID=A0A941DEQ9_9MICO|nr:YetF domain-containing protein [Phycicoccus avicenniae]MBR7744942.1 DUF421 domain-containing protein [Phycicoccus avicenniae]
MDALVAHLGISAFGALGVALSATVLYVAVAVVLRVWGRRASASASTGTIALLTLVGSIAARATLGEWPTLAGGLVAIGTILVLERAFGRWSSAVRGLRRTRRGRRGRDPVVLMVGARIHHDELHRAGLTEAALWGVLRQHGIGHRADVGVVVLETRGHVSVLRSDHRLERSALAGVRGGEDVPDAMLSPDEGPDGGRRGGGRDGDGSDAGSPDGGTRGSGDG